MAYVGGGWALLGNHLIWSYSDKCNMYFQVFAWSEQDAINNRSTVHTRTRILVENLNPSYSGYYLEQDWSAGVTGAPDYSVHATFSDGGAGTSKEYILQNGSFTVNHDSNGNASSKIYYWFNGTYTGAIGIPTNTKVVDISLPKIDRTANMATISNVGSTYNTMYCTISVPFDSVENQRSRDGSNWTTWNKSIKADTPFVDTWTGLKPNTKYTGYYRFKRKYNGVWSEAVSFTATTTKYPDAPSKGSVSLSSVTSNSAKVSWSGFSVNEGATIDHYEYSLDNSNWINVGTDTQINLDNLSPETSYTLYVRIVDNFGSKSDSATLSFKTLVDQLKIAYNTNLYQTEILTKDGVDILAKNGDNLIVDTIGKERLRTARVFYNENGVIKIVKAAYYNKKGNIQHFKNYEN